ncbi:hypothetical protein T484DRAFT_1755822 [Baffinella frigidus]|nr:hypothetical protein T484DRAFT_1755822 [Cryptophyta sp. CCMP2293]
MPPRHTLEDPPPVIDSVYSERICIDVDNIEKALSLIHELTCKGSRVGERGMLATMYTQTVLSQLRAAPMDNILPLRAYALHPLLALRLASMLCSTVYLDFVRYLHKGELLAQSTLRKHIHAYVYRMQHVHAKSTTHSVGDIDKGRPPKFRPQSSGSHARPLQPKNDEGPEYLGWCQMLPFRDSFDDDSIAGVNGSNTSGGAN